MKLLPEKFDIVESPRDRLDFLRQEEQRIAEEIRAHKGKDPYLPGFDGKLRDLNTGGYVRVTVVAKTIDKKGEDAVAPSRTEVAVIVVLTKEQAEKAQAARP